MIHVAAVLLGYVLDLIVGDPYNLPHPIRWIGNLIAALEKALRRVFPKTPAGERAGGVALVVLVAGISTACAVLLLWLCGLVAWWLQFAVETIMCYQMLATKSLRVESMKVHKPLYEGDLPAARHAVSMIVGRDTDRLDEQGVAKATVETIAENASDGVIAPLLFMGLFGAPGAVFYKAVNTMDSMVGYKNDKYLHFGRAAAKFDDVLNFIPARVAGVLMCAGAGLAQLDARGAWRIFKRDRRNHTSPNSAHTEAACAGALGIQLAGSNYYFGKLVEKPTIGDATRPIELEDIVRTNKLLYATSALGLLVSLLLRVLVILALGAVL